MAIIREAIINEDADSVNQSRIRADHEFYDAVDLHESVPRVAFREGGERHRLSKRCALVALDI